jgi:hypothetical protein
VEPAGRLLVNIDQRDQVEAGLGEELGQAASIVAPNRG